MRVAERREKHDIESVAVGAQVSANIERIKIYCDGPGTVGREHTDPSVFNVEYTDKSYPTTRIVSNKQIYKVHRLSQSKPRMSARDDKLKKKK